MLSNLVKKWSILTALTLLLLSIEPNFCQKQATLGSPCFDDEVCSTILHASCFDNKCRCRVNTKKVNASCVPLIGGFCWQDKDCGIENAKCIDHMCQCIEFHLAVSDDQCSPALIGSYCTEDSSCKGVKFAVCIDGSCQCSHNTKALNPAACLPLLKVRCRENSDCKPENSACIDNECQCTPQFVPYGISKCVEPYLTMPCDNERQCSRFLNRTVCSGGRCACDSFSTMQDGKCLPNWSVTCFDGESCSGKHSECIDNKCQCKAAFIYKYRCLPLELNTECEEHSDCFEIRFAMCIDGHCQCRANFTQVGASCAPLLKEFCTNTVKCTVENSECIDNKCQCSEGYRQRDNAKCSQIELGARCKHDSHCSLIPNGVCSASERCECVENSFVINGTCSPVLKGRCSTENRCYSNSLRCINGTCQCRKNWIPSGHFCAKKRQLYSCKIAIECSDPWHSLCTPDGKCSCQSNNLMTGKATCLPLIDGKCWRNDQCKAKDTICVDYRCQCKPNYAYIARNYCEPTFD